MEVTQNHLEELGYNVDDTSSNRSYDFLIKKGDEEVKVEEVKVKEF